jgi:NAD(P)-dependent dehydrogenase (short-subunit alcohol dehydrogenase family)
MAEGRVVVITGASAGIGRAAAIAFGSRGWRVALVARGREGLEGAKRDVELVGGQAMVIEADMADPEQVDAAAARVEAEWGPLDVWVNNAMATLFGPFLTISPDDFRHATNVTYLGAVWGTRAALKQMSKRNRGTIVQVGSALAYRSIPLQSAYCGAKSALRGFTDSLRSELIHDGSRVHVTMVQLSAFNTPQFGWARNLMGRRAQPVGRIFQPELAGEAIFWASQHQRREVWVGFPAVQAILGTRLIPGFLDRLLAWRAYDGQLTDEPLPADYRDNLHRPVPGDHGRRGRYTERSVPSSLQFRLNTHRGPIAAAAIAIALAALGVWLGAS